MPAANLPVCSAGSQGSRPSGRAQQGRQGPSLSTWAKEKMIAVAKRAGTAPIRRVKAPWSNPRKKSSSTSGAPITANVITTTHPAVPEGVIPRTVGEAEFGVPKPDPATTMQISTMSGSDAADPPTEEPEPKVFEPGPRQPVVHRETPRAVQSGGDHDGADESHPERELARQEIPRVVRRQSDPAY